VTLRWRLILALLGITLFCLAVTSLVYRWWPLPVTREDFQPPPTLFAPPEASVPGIETA
jgi:hypothetical protein